MFAEATGGGGAEPRGDRDLFDAAAAGADRARPAEATEAVSEEIKGPRTLAPPQALEGFLRKTG
jgi:glycyl-tRNA synthetase beta chain